MRRRVVPAWNFPAAVVVCDHDMPVLSEFVTCAHFLWAGLVRQRQTGGIVPSQRILVDKMIAPIGSDHRGPIVELGAGNGALTCRLAARCPEARILACEINPVLADDARQRLKRAGLAGRARVITGAAERLLSRLARARCLKPDFIVSGIPLGHLSLETASCLLDAIHHALADGGTYIQFQHSLLSRKHIMARFSSLEMAPVVLNFPPAVVYYARK